MTSEATPSTALLVTPVVPAPTGGGAAMRAWDWVSDLRREHRVEVVVIAREAPAPEAGAALREAGVVVHHLPARYARRWVRPLGMLVPGLTRWRHAWLRSWPEPTTVPDHLHRVATGAELVVAFRLRALDAAHVLAQPDVDVVLDLDDLESATHRSLAACERRLGRRRRAWALARTARQYRHLEHALLPHVTAVHVAAEQDAADLRTWCDVPVTTRPNRVAVPLGDGAAPARDAGTSHDLLLVGSLDYPPNEEAARELAGPVAAALRSRGDLPLWRVVVAGRSGPDDLLADLRAAGAVVIDSPARLEDVYRHATLAVIPLRAGGGTKIKTIEAIGHGLGVVATPEAVRGLPLRDGHEVLLASDAPGLASAAATLLGDPARLAALSRAARARLVDAGLLIDEPREVAGWTT